MSTPPRGNLRFVVCRAIASVDFPELCKSGQIATVLYESMTVPNGTMSCSLWGNSIETSCRATVAKIDGKSSIYVEVSTVEIELDQGKQDFSSNSAIRTARITARGHVQSVRRPKSTLMGGSYPV